MNDCRDPYQPLNSILECIGCTPILRLNRSVPDGAATVYAKVEFFNPGGSIKDRIGLAMIEQAEKQGFLKPGMTVIEATSGNTAVALAQACAIKKHPLILVMPKNYSPEYRKTLQAYGVQLILTPEAEGMAGAIQKAKEIIREHDEYFMPQQFKNRINPQIHLSRTAQEILNDLGTQPIDALVAGLGSGGTLMGVGKGLQASHPHLKIVGVEFPQAWRAPAQSRKDHLDFYDARFVDQMIEVSDEEAYLASKKLARTEGCLVGIESGAVYCGALKVAQELGSDKTVVAIFPDAGGRYFSLDPFFK